MSWPPPGVDLALTDRLLEQAKWAEAQSDDIDALYAEFGRLRDAASDPTAAKTGDLLAGAEDLARRAADSGDPTLIVEAGGLCAELLLDAGRFAEALARLRRVREAYAPVAASGGAAERGTDVRLLGSMGRAALALGEWATASASFGEAIATMERDRYRISAPYLQSAFLQGRVAIYTGGVLAAYNLRDYPTMLARAELSKARGVMRLHSANERAPNRARLEEFWRVCEQIRALDPAGLRQAESSGERAAKSGGERAAEASGDDAAFDALLEERRRLWDLLVIERFGQSGSGPAFSLPELQRTLAPDTGILYYYWLDQTVLFVAAIDRERVVVEPVRLTNEHRRCLKTVQNFVSAAFSELDSTQLEKFDRSIRACAALLPEKLHPIIVDKQRLLISPNRRLHLFPFHALPWGAGFLIESFAITYVPNLSTLLGASRLPAEPKVLVAGVGEFPASFAALALPAVRSEVDGVARAWRAAGIETAVLAGPELTRRQLDAWNRERTLETFSCIHLATHGSSVLAKDTVDTPMESRLLLADGALDGLEISCLRLNAGLVVLSACSSGQRAVSGRQLGELPGDEVFGIQSAFAMAGANAVLGCLWPANDQIAHTVMIDFHRNLARGGRADSALQTALTDYLQNTKERHCYEWAPFFFLTLGPRR